MATTTETNMPSIKIADDISVVTTNGKKYEGLVMLVLPRSKKFVMLVGHGSLWINLYYSDCREVKIIFTREQLNEGWLQKVLVTDTNRDIKKQGYTIPSMIGTLCIIPTLDAETYLVFSSIHVSVKPE